MPNPNGSEIIHPDFGAINYLVVVAYLVGMLVIAWWASKRSGNMEGFFVGNRQMNFFVVGVSMFSTYMSALTMMGLPSAAFGKYNLFWTAQYPIIVIPAFLVARYLVKLYRDAGVISIYEYFEQRIHVSARVIGAGSFVILSIGRSGLILLMPALAFHIVTGFSIEATILIMGTVITIYTVVGGITAVIWTDFAQACIMIVGAILSIVAILMSTGFSRFVDIAAEYHKFDTFRGGFDVTKELTFWLILSAIFEGVRCWGTQQDMTQRYLTTPTTQKAKASVWIAALSYIPFGYLFHFIGVALFVFYFISPDVGVQGLIDNDKTDAIYPFFITTQLPVGLSGLVIAAIFAGAMSSIDSCMNSASAVCIEDFFKRFARKPRSEAYYLKLAKYMTLLWGVLVIAMAFGFRNIQYAQEMWPKVMSVSTNGLLGLLGLVLWPRPITKWGVIVGFVSGSIVLCWCMFATDINYLLWPVIGNTVCFVVGLAVSRVTRGSIGNTPDTNTSTSFD